MLRSRFISFWTCALAATACSGSKPAAVAADSSGTAAMTPPSAAVAATPGAAKAPAAADPQMQAVLDQLSAFGGKPLETLTAVEARKQPTPASAAMAVLIKQGKDTSAAIVVPGVTSMDRTIPGPSGPMSVRIYTPSGAGPFPVIVYYHGGGWVIASKSVYDGGARSISKYANAVVVSVDYRLAPEHKFPAQHDDALATYRWAVENAATIHGDPKRMGIAGESAGGNLAMATAVAVRDAKLPMPKAVVSVYPIAQPDTMTASYVENATASPLSRPAMVWFFKQEVRSPADEMDPRLDLLKANLSGLPPVTIINAQIDPLRDDGAMLEQALKSAGVSVERRVYDGVTHEFFGMGAVIDKAKQAEQYAGDRFKAGFGS